MNLKLSMRLLAKEGPIIVDGAEDGLVAVEKVMRDMEEGDDFHVILMDYQMPIMDGPTASNAIREMGSEAVIVGVTGNVMPEDVRFFKQNGANAVLAKPLLKLPVLEDRFVEYDMRANEDGIMEPGTRIHFLWNESKISRSQRIEEESVSSLNFDEPIS